MQIQQLKHLAVFSGPKDEKQAQAIKRYLRIGGIVLAIGNDILRREE